MLGSNYGKMMSYAAQMDLKEYAADLDTCGVPRHGLRRGRSDRIVLDAFPGTTSSRKEMLGGVRKDKALFDYLGKELPDVTYKNLKYLLLEIFKGKKQWDAPVDEGARAKNADIIKQEGRGMFSSMDANKVADCLLAGPPSETRLLAERYEKKYGKSLKAKLEKKGPKVWATASRPYARPPRRIRGHAARGAMKGFTDEREKLVRLLGGLDASRPSMPRSHREEVWEDSCATGTTPKSATS